MTPRSPRVQCELQPLFALPYGLGVAGARRDIQDDAGQFDHQSGSVTVCTSAAVQEPH